MADEGRAHQPCSQSPRFAPAFTNRILRQHGIELLDEPMEAVAKRRMLTVVEGAGTRI